MPESTTEENKTETAGETSADTSTETDVIEGYDALGDAGKQALDRMKSERDAAVTAAKEAKGDPNAAAKIKATRDELAKANAAVAALQAKIDGKEVEFAKAQEASAVEKAALDKANGRIIRSEVKAAAKGVLADPQDAYKFLDIESFEVDDDGNVDEDAIAKALAGLVAAKPYLAAQGGTRFQGSADGGTRNESKPATLEEQIADAEKAGDWKRARQLKTGHLLELNKTTI